MPGSPSPAWRCWFAFASLRGTAWEIVGVSVYGASMIFMFMTSTIYHAIPTWRAKRVLRVLDHAGIFLAIAGTYTPFTLGNLRGPWGWTLFGVVWSLAVIGIVYKALALTRLRVLGVVVYVAIVTGDRVAVIAVGEHDDTANALRSPRRVTRPPHDLAPNGSYILTVG